MKCLDLEYYDDDHESLTVVRLSLHDNDDASLLQLIIFALLVLSIFTVPILFLVLAILPMQRSSIFRVPLISLIPI